MPPLERRDRVRQRHDDAVRHRVPVLGDDAQRALGRVRRHGDAHFDQTLRLKGNIVDEAGPVDGIESIPCVSSKPRTIDASISECVRKTTANPSA